MVPRKLVRLACLVCLACVLGTTTSVPPCSAEAAHGVSSPAFVMRPAASFLVSDADVAIIGGEQADTADWPATFVFSDTCTSTLVGDRVVLTAAHCVPDGARGIVDLGTESLGVTCHHHSDYEDGVPDDAPDWWQRVSPDFALCRLDGVISGLDAEWVNQDPGVPARGDPLRLLGFGCNAQGGSDSGFGVLFEGDADVIHLPGDGEYRLDGQTVDVPAEGVYYTQTEGGAAVCYGDSGGAAYRVSGGTRSVVGVNSRGDIDTISWISATNVPGFLRWATEWAEREGVTLCGVHRAAAGCRVQ